MAGRNIPPNIGRFNASETLGEQWSYGRAHLIGEECPLSLKDPRTCIESASALLGGHCRKWNARDDEIGGSKPMLFQNEVGGRGGRGDRQQTRIFNGSAEMAGKSPADIDGHQPAVSRHPFKEGSGQRSGARSKFYNDARIRPVDRFQQRFDQIARCREG